ncbi:MAG: beta strand repeat-containing protein, partial [Acetobacteraceae bacterium]
VDAGGTISANGVAGQHGGTVLVQGVGGSISIAGTLTASGEGSGGTGGAIGLDATGSVAVAGTARIDASGPAGGGVVGIGTTLARTKGGPGTPAGLTARNVGIAPGATISADATASGNGGRVVVLSTAHTKDDGAITAEGGPAGGHGGFVEVSGHDLALDGTVNTGAPLGVMGTILLDPYNLQIVTTGADDGDVTTTPVNGVAAGSGNTTPGSPPDTVSAGVIEGLTGNVTLQAMNNLEVSANLELTGPGQSLLMEAGNNLTVDPGFTVSATGDLEMDAASTASGLIVNPDGALVMNGVVSAGGNIRLQAGQGGMSLGDGTGTDGNISVNPTTGSIVLFSTGDLVQNSGIITAGTLSGTALVGASLPDNNVVANLGPFTAVTAFTFNDAGNLTIIGAIAQDEEVFGSGVTVRAAGNVTVNAGVSVSGTGNVEIEASPATGELLMDGAISAGGNVSLSAGTGGILLGRFSDEPAPNGDVSATTGTVALSSSSGFIEQNDGTIAAEVLTGSSPSVFLEGNNAIGTLGAFSVPSGSDIFLNDTVGLTVAGPLSAVDSFVSLSTAGNLIFSGTLNATGQAVALTAGGSITEPGGAILADTLSGSSGGAALFTGVNAIGTLAAISGDFPPAPPAFTAGGNFTLVDSVPLTVTAPVSVPVGQTIALVTDGLTEGSQTIFTEGPPIVFFGALEAPGGEVSVQPFTASVPVALVGAGPQPAGALSLDNALLAGITAGTLALTSFAPEPITISGANPLGGLTDPNTGAASGVDALVVKAGGAFSEAAGASLTVGTLTGTAELVALGGANVISTLGPFSSTGGFEMTDTTALTVIGTVMDATGVTLDDTGGGMLIGSTTAAGLISSPGTVNLMTAFDIVESRGAGTTYNGAITAGTLSGSAGEVFLSGPNAIATLGTFVFDTS